MALKFSTHHGLSLKCFDIDPQTATAIHFLLCYVYEFHQMSSRCQKPNQPLKL